MINDEALELINQSIRDHYLETYNRLPTPSEYKTDFVNAYHDLLFFGQAKIPREESPKQFSTQDYLGELLKDPVTKASFDLLVKIKEKANE